jgi:RNA polymerase sigma-70 factor (family 1)
MLQQTEQTPEPEFVQRLRQADTEVFWIIYNTYKSKLYWYCLKFIKSAEVAEEIVQDVFVTLWERKESLHPDSSLGAYLHTVAKHRILNHLKKESRNAAYLKEKRLLADEAVNTTEMELVYADYLELAQAAITRLPPQRQLIYKMSREEDMSNQEIALALGISKNTVKVQLVKALKALRASLGLKSGLIILFFLLTTFFPGT